MAKRFSRAVVPVCLIAVAGILAVSVWRSQNLAEVPEKPADTALEFWITENVEQVDWSNFDEPYGMFGGRAYLGSGYPLQWSGGAAEVPKEHVIYTITAWPDVADGGDYVTGIEITDPFITVYGLSINAAFDEFDRIFEGQGYTLEVFRNDFQEGHQAEKNGIVFCLERGIFIAEGELESKLTISARLSNRENICF